MAFYRDRHDLSETSPSSKVDVLVLEYTTIHPEQIRDIGAILLQSGASRALVVCGFASSTTLERLESARIIPLNGPIQRSELRRWCLVLNARQMQAPGLPVEAGIGISGPLSAQRFDEDALVRIIDADAIEIEDEDLRAGESQFAGGFNAPTEFDARISKEGVAGLTPC